MMAAGDHHDGGRSETVPTSDDFLPTASWPALRLRDALLRRLRIFFHARDFIEVDTPLLSADVVVDRHLEPFGIDVAAGGHTRRMWLQTSPEFAMKRLMAAGGEAIFQVTHAFRQEEQGPLHNPEFTMVEWYRRGDGLADGMRLLGELADTLLGRGEPEAITYRAAFERYAGIDPHVAGTQEMAMLADRRGIAAPESFSAADRDAWLDLLLVEFVQPQLGRGRPAIVYDYPASQAALARVRPEEPAVAERFELYVDGIELANGYHELLDARVLRERNRANNRLRAACGKPQLPEESRLLTAMEAGLPNCAGVAMGFDRVVMLAAGANGLPAVMPFPFDRA
jgi:lysyl-tRNA synthetase class 2